MTIQNETLNWHFPAGSTADGREIVRITPEVARWGYSGLRVLDLAAGEVELGDTGGNEMIVLPLTGSCGVDTDAGGADLAGRADVFSAVTDCAYVPRDTAYRISTDARRPVRAGQRPVRRGGAAVPAREGGRGPGRDARRRGLLAAGQQLRHPGRAGGRPADRLRGVHPGRELVVVPAAQARYASGPANRSWRRSTTSRWRTARPDPARAWPTSGCTARPDRPADVLAEVRSGDVVIVPHGWHGPSMAVPGYDLYYLNVMAGPGRREWLICDDPAHSWVREQWKNQPVDPRVTTWSTP